MRWLAVVFLAACGFRGFNRGDGGPHDAPVADTPGDVYVGPPPTSPRKLTFDNTASSEDLVGFPVLVILTPATVDYAAVGNPSTDLRFEDAENGTDLPFEVERWVPDGESIVWVQVPQINNGSADDYVLMHFGSGAQGTEDPAGVWTSQDVVTHFKPSSYTNSAGSAYDGNPIAMSQAPGKIGLAAAFPGGGNHGVTFDNGGALFDGWQQFTLEFWIYGDYANLGAVSGQSNFMDKGTSLNLGRFFVSPGPPDPPERLVLQIDLHFTNNNNVFLNREVKLQTWTYVVYTFDGTEVQLYIDGQEVGSDFMTGGTQQMRADTSGYHIGSVNAAFPGMFDELRISSQLVRSLDWVRAQHLSMNRAFVTFGDPP